MDNHPNIFHSIDTFGLNMKNIGRHLVHNMSSKLNDTLFDKKVNKEEKTLTISIGINKSILSTFIFRNTKCPISNDWRNACQTFSILWSYAYWTWIFTSWFFFHSKSCVLNNHQEDKSKNLDKYCLHQDNDHQNNLLHMTLILILFQLDMKDIDYHLLHNMLNNFLNNLFYLLVPFYNKLGVNNMISKYHDSPQNNNFLHYIRMYMFCLLGALILVYIYLKKKLSITEGRKEKKRKRQRDYEVQ